MEGTYISKRFDQEAIFNRLMQRLQVSEDWSAMIAQGTIGNLMNVIAEGNAEIARYLEYLYNEKKWINARNMSSITHLTDLISYKRALPKSAIGFVIVSHTDLEGQNRLQNFGSYFFNLDQTSDWDNLTQNPRATPTERAALVPWTADQSYLIPKGTIFKTTSGISLISIEDVESRALKEPFNAIRRDATKYADFIKAGGWNGIKYLKIPVIQGTPTNLQFGRATGERFESFTIDNLNVENASNMISNKYFKINVTPVIFDSSGVEIDSNITEVWEQIIDIRLAGPYDKVFEKSILNDSNKVLIKFGDGITGQRLPEMARISCDYLYTLGNSGNIDNRFQVTNMILPTGYSQIDYRFNTISNFLSCTNVAPIMGGKDIEAIEEIRTNAPPTYLESYSIATKASYLQQIIKNSPVNLLHCRIFQSNVINNESYGDTNTDDFYISSISENSVLQEISINKNALLITGIRANGTKIEDPMLELIDPLIKAFDDNSSPNDNFDYIEPNFIRIRPNIIINTSDSITENEIYETIMPDIMGEYSIFTTDFEREYHKSTIVDLVQNYGFNKYSTIFLEAKANVDYKPQILTRIGGTDKRENIWPGNTSSNPGATYSDESFPTLLAFKFNFDKSFSSNLLNAGFKNFRHNNSILLRADLKYRNDPTKNKTLLLLDNRTDLRNPPSIMEANKLTIDPSKPMPTILPSNYQMRDLNFFDKNSEDFINQQSRTAQFNFIDRIISPSYWNQIKQWDCNPIELRHFYTDNLGKNKVLSAGEIKSDYKRDIYDMNKNPVPLSVELAPTTKVYQRNPQYIPNCNLIFYENYENIKDPLYATGYLVLPLNRVLSALEASQLWTELEGVEDWNTIMEILKFMITSNFTIDVYAQPVRDDFECMNPYDIIFSERSDTLIQKNFLKSV